MGGRLHRWALVSQLSSGWVGVFCLVTVLGAVDVVDNVLVIVGFKKYYRYCLCRRHLLQDKTDGARLGSSLGEAQCYSCCYMKHTANHGNLPLQPSCCHIYSVWMHTCVNVSCEIISLHLGPREFPFSTCDKRSAATPFLLGAAAPSFSTDKSLMFLNFTVVSNPDANSSLPCYQPLLGQLFKVNIHTRTWC